MQTLYILYSLKDHKLYVGRTTNLYERLATHFKGGVIATKHRLPLKLIHKEHFKTASEAAKRERFLKSLWGAKDKRNILKEYLVNSFSN